MSDESGDSKEKPKTGRPTKLTPEIQEEIVKLLQAGVYVEVACEAVGVGYSTLRDWMRWGARGTEPYASFSDAVTRARATAEVSLVLTARRGDDKGVSNGKAKCAQWLLERTRGNRYAARVSVKVEEELETLLGVIERVCSEKDCGCYERLLEVLMARAGGEEAREPSGEEGTELH